MKPLFTSGFLMPFFVRIFASFCTFLRVLYPFLLAFCGYANNFATFIYTICGYARFCYTHIDFYVKKCYCVAVRKSSAREQNYDCFNTIYDGSP